jgi:hypothetical protein
MQLKELRSTHDRTAGRLTQLQDAMRASSLDGARQDAVLASLEGEHKAILKDANDALSQLKNVYSDFQQAHEETNSETRNRGPKAPDLSTIQTSGSIIYGADFECPEYDELNPGDGACQIKCRDAECQYSQDVCVAVMASHGCTALSLNCNLPDATGCWSTLKLSSDAVQEPGKKIIVFRGSQQGSKLEDVCVALQNEFGVMVGKMWESLSQAQQKEWEDKDCDRHVLGATCVVMTMTFRFEKMSMFIMF